MVQIASDFGKRTWKSLKGGGGFLLDFFPEIIRNKKIMNCTLIWGEVCVVVPNGRILVILYLHPSALLDRICMQIYLLVAEMQ